MKRTPIRRWKPKPQRRVGKLGIVRLSGKAMDKLRWDCLFRDGFMCQRCGKFLSLYTPNWPGHPDAYHMAHIHAKRNGGDTLDNVRALCGDCHRAEHGNPLPKSGQT